MKTHIILVAIAASLVACDARISTATPERVVEKNTTVITPPAKEETRVEKNTVIVNPPGATTEEKKTTTTTETKR